MPVAMRTTYQKAEAKYNVTTDFHSLGLHSAAATGNVGLVEYALDHGQPINSVIDGVLPLHAACAGGNVQVVKLLIDHGADVNAPRLPRRYSNDKNRDSSAPIVGTSGSTPLHFAAANGNTAAVNLLLLHGAHADRSDKHGVTPEMLARQHGWLECAEVLKQWLVNKDRDLRERPGGATQNDSNAPFRERIGSFGSDVDSPSTRRRLQVKHSIDTALNKLKSSATDIRLHPPSSTASLMATTPPASPIKPLGEYTFVPISPSDDGTVIDPGARRPSLPHILQPCIVSRSRKTSTPNSTLGSSPRRPRSAGNGAEDQEPDTPNSSQGKPVVRKLGSKYSLMNLFKKAQASDSAPSTSTDIVQSTSSTSPLALGTTTALPMSTSPGQPSPLSQTLTNITDSPVPASSRSAIRVHRGSDASPRSASQQTHTTQPLNRKTSGTMSQSPRPSAIELHNALVQERRRQRDRSRSTGSGPRFSLEQNLNPSPSPNSSPLQRLGLRAQIHTRNRSGSGSSIGTSSTPGYRGGAVFDDDVVVTGDGEPGRSGARPSILRTHGRTSSGHVPGTPQGYRALRFDSTSSANAQREGDSEGLRSMHILRGSSSTGSLGRRRMILGREPTPQSRVSEENLAPDSAPAAVSDFDSRKVIGKDGVADDEEDEEYGQPLHDECSPIIDPGEVKPRLLSSFASSSQSSLSPIMPNDTETSAIINSEFPFSINKPPMMDSEEVEPMITTGNLLPVPSVVDHRSRGASISSTSTSDSNNPQLSVSGTTSGSGSDTITTPWFSSPGRDEFFGVAHSSPRQHANDFDYGEVDSSRFKLENPSETRLASFSERRTHIPPDIDISAVSSHAIAEALVQKAQQDILDMASEELTPVTASTGRSPLSARLAAYGESLALERRLREQKEQEEQAKKEQEEQSPRSVRSRQPSDAERGILSVATTPTNTRRNGPNGIERQHSLEHRPHRAEKSRKKDPKRPSTAEGDTPSSADQAGHFHQSSQSTSGLISSPRPSFSFEPDTNVEEVPFTSSMSASLSVSPPKRDPSPGPRIIRSRTPVPESSDGLSRISSRDCVDTDTELGPPLLRVSTAPHGSNIRGGKTATKLTKMGFPTMEQIRAPPTNTKRFGAFRTLVQSLKGRT
ncbi:hypothetical protein H0H92_013750 [Tricholoma furcatifolium]|nr:hypothetical protein H0H92_013750 [Tricholoma furcatifolium]